MPELNGVHKGRIVGSTNKQEPIVPLHKFPIKVTLSALKALGFLKAYIMSCVTLFDTQYNLGNAAKVLWLPTMETHWCVSTLTLSSALNWLVAHDYLTYLDPAVTPSNFYAEAGYYKSTGAHTLVSGPFLRLPPPRKIPYGRLPEYMVLARLLSSGRDHCENICGTRFIAKCLRMNRHTVISCLRDLESAGAIQQRMNLRTVNVAFTDHQHPTRRLPHND
jgi:hypothetical protein